MYEIDHVYILYNPKLICSYVQMYTHIPFPCTPYLSSNSFHLPPPPHSPFHTSSSKAIKLVRTAELKPFVVYCRAPNINYMKKHWVPKGQIKVHIACDMYSETSV